jgi:murein endopeptidase
LRDHRAADPDAARVGVGDLSRPGGGPFTGPGGHVSHQNGLDVDVLYPRRDRRLRPPIRLAQVDRRRTQDLVDRFVAAGAERVFVDARLGLTGPPEIVQPWPSHDDHLHVRFHPRASAGPRRG